MVGSSHLNPCEFWSSVVLVQSLMSSSVNCLNFLTSLWIQDGTFVLTYKRNLKKRLGSEVDTLSCAGCQKDLVLIF